MPLGENGIHTFLNTFQVSGWIVMKGLFVLGKDILLKDKILLAHSLNLSLDLGFLNASAISPAGVTHTLSVE